MQAEDLQKRQVHLQKRICILLCTVFPLLTTVATLLRLWQVGVFTFPVQQGRTLFFPLLLVHSSTILVCPRGWHSFSSSCISPLPVPANWSSATRACAGLGARLPTVHSEQMNNFLLTKFQPPPVARSQDWQCHPRLESRTIFQLFQAQQCTPGE